MLLVIIFTLVLMTAFSVYCSANIRSGYYVQSVCHLRTDERVMALTFDDGPDETVTPQILDILAKYTIKAIFFCIGSKIEGNAELVQRIMNEGHAVGNHSYSHVATFPLLSLLKMKADILQCEAAIKKITKSQENSLFRPPFGVTNPVLAKALKQLGYTSMGWNVRSFDTTKSAQQVVKRINSRQNARNIILLHDTTKAMTEILPQIIDSALKNGYRFVRADKYI